MPLSASTFAADYNFNRSSTGTALTSGMVTGFAANSPRMTEMGWLIEASASNYYLRSDEFNNTWLLVNVSATADTTVAPDGTTTADTIGEGTSAGEHYWEQSLALAPNQYITQSIFVKPLTGRYFGMHVYDQTSAGSNIYAGFDLVTLSVIYNGALGSGVIQAAGIIPCANGWYRLWITGKPGVSTAVGIIARLRALGAGGAATYTGVGATFAVWGGQFELGRTLTAYIKNASNSAPAVRAAESPTLQSSVLAAAIVSKQATIVTEALIDRDEFTDSYPMLWTLQDAGGGNRISLCQGFNAKRIALEAQFVAGNADLAPAIYTKGAAFRFACSFGNGLLRSSFNGGVVVSAYFNSANISLSAMHIGNLSGGNNLCGYLRRMIIYPYILSDADMMSQSIVGSAPLSLSL